MSEPTPAPDGISASETNIDNRSALLAEIKARLSEAGEGAHLGFVGTLEDGRSLILTTNPNLPLNEQSRAFIGKPGEEMTPIEGVEDEGLIRDWYGPQIGTIEGNVTKSDGSVEGILFAFPHPYDIKLQRVGEPPSGPRYGQVAEQNNHGYIITGPETGDEFDLGYEIQPEGHPLTKDAFDAVHQKVSAISGLKMQTLTPVEISEEELV